MLVSISFTGRKLPDEPAGFGSAHLLAISFSPRLIHEKLTVKRLMVELHRIREHGAKTIKIAHCGCE